MSIPPEPVFGACFLEELTSPGYGCSCWEPSPGGEPWRVASPQDAGLRTSGDVVNHPETDPIWGRAEF